MQKASQSFWSYLRSGSGPFGSSAQLFTPELNPNKFELGVQTFQTNWQRASLDISYHQGKYASFELQRQLSCSALATYEKKNAITTVSGQ
jgi:hypothetical protein